MQTHVACQGLESCKPRLHACEDVKEECTLCTLFSFFEKKKASFVLAKLHILKDIDQKIITIKNWNEQNN